MQRAFLFDMDGTLIDTEPLWVEAVETVIHALGFPITRAEAGRLVYGRSWHDIYRELVARWPDFPLPIQVMQNRLTPIFLALRGQRDVRIQSSIALLRRLAADHPVALVSGSPRPDVDAGIKLMEIGGLIRFSLASDDYSPGKPDPICYLQAATRLGLSPADCVVFEDSAAGVRAAKAAGAWCVALARPNPPLPQDLSPADEILADLADFRAH
jgi:HAD superfamily hydrolase (TIGR01509 family)